MGKSFWKFYWVHGSRQSLRRELAIRNVQLSDMETDRKSVV